MYRATARRILLSRLEGPIAHFLARLGLSPNALTLLGLALVGGSAYLVSTGHFLLAGVLLLVSGAFDILDGVLARGTNRVTAFGGLLDSVSDRIGEAGMFLGLLVFYLSPTMKAELILVYLALAGSFMVSYLRARAEGLGIECNVGVMTRPERLFLLALGLIINQVPIILGIIVALTLVTSAQRVIHIWNAARAR